ncbi:glutamate 5-kinase [Gracilimonas mengyeensis]|nr:glutamate 5-kinase [Gracilimonas mengyeensis]
MSKKQANRNQLPDHLQRIVIKVGSRILVNEEGRPNLEQIERLTGQISELVKEGREVILVSSGAIAAGVESLGWEERPTQLPELQMAAALGQSVLMNHYATAFSKLGCRIGQILLTHADLKNRERHLNARNTMLTMLRNNVIPVVNENDVVAVDEIRFGDNDVLASMVSALIDGDLLILLTTADGFLQVEDGQLKDRIPVLEAITEDTLAMAQGKGSNWSSGGMASKLKSAQHAAHAGTPVVIANGLKSGIIRQILDGEDVGTLLLPRKQPIKARKKWIAFFHRPQGDIFVDDGASKAICMEGNSLLPVGIRKTEGKFGVGDLVNIKDTHGKTIARGLTAYSNDDIERIKGQHSNSIKDILGTVRFDEVVHRDNLVVLEEG